MYKNNFKSRLKRAYKILKTEGLVSLAKRIRDKYYIAREQIRRDENFYTFDSADDFFPKVSIIIPVFNAWELTKSCLESIYRETLGITFEIIVINNKSTDSTQTELESLSKEKLNLTVKTMQENIGFGPGVNVGLQNARGQYIVILNNDTIVSPNWLNNLLSVMDSDSDIGIVSPITNYLGEGPQIDSDAVNMPPDIGVISQFSKFVSERNTVFYESSRLVFFCVALRRELIDTIGYLDDGYQKGNFEDDDYCLRTRIAGYRLAIAQNSFVYHHGSATFKKNHISHTKWMEVNRTRFYKKAGFIASTRFPSKTISLGQVVISVVVRTKDRPYLLRKALSSLSNQTYKSIEVIVVNDGGFDVSEILEEFDKFFSIKYICHAESKGRTASINAALNHVCGQWVGFLDDDDILYPWHFEALLQEAIKSNNKVVYSDYNLSLFRQSKDIWPIQIKGSPAWDFNRNELLIENHIPIHSYIFDYRCIDTVGYWNESLDRLEDYEFLLRLSLLSSFHRVPKVNCEYRFYLDSEQTISNGRREYLEALRHIYQLYPTENPIINKGREKIINALNNQTEEIENLMRSGTNKQNIQRKIVQICVGL